MLNPHRDKIYNLSNNQLPKSEFKNSTNLLKKIQLVTNYFIRKPHASAQQLLFEFSLDKHELIFIYKYIQNSNIIQNEFRISQNCDYCNILDSYIKDDRFEVTFFVGLFCPYRCIFCPNVFLAANGRRILNRYGTDSKDKIGKKIIKQIFKDLTVIKRTKKNVVIKISGGLEPLTDYEKVKFIVDESNRKAFPVILYTNGALLTSAETREMVLKTDETRISLNALNNDDFNELCLGANHRQESNLSFSRIKHNVMLLQQDKKRLGSKTKLGMNSVIIKLHSNYLSGLTQLAYALGFDYLNFRSNYKEILNEEKSNQIYQQRKLIEQNIRDNKLGKLVVNFPSSLSKHSTFADKPHGKCNPEKQIKYKVFIDPFGYCYPLHEFALPDEKSSETNTNTKYSLGRITKDNRLVDILNSKKMFPEVDYQRLNPLELSIALEIERQEKDRIFGHAIQKGPYSTNRV